MLRWLKSGLLPSYLTGGGWRRVRRSDLLTFMISRGMSVPLELDPGPPRVAIVDDNQAFAKAVRRFLKGRCPGVDVRMAHDGFEAGLLLLDFHPHLILLDIVMPGVDGFGVCRRIKLQPQLANAAIWVISGNLDDQAREQFEELGVAGCLSKPMDEQQLLAIVEQHLPRVGAPA